MTKPLPPLFDDAVDGCQEYVACRDHEFKRPTRERLEDAWQRYGQMHPDRRRFIGEFRDNFADRSWELWLMAVLADSGASLQRVGKEGLDILIQTPDGGRCWIEAVAVGPGEKENPNYVWQRQPDNLGPSCGPKDENVILRFLAALDRKQRNIERYRSKSIIGESDPCLVALSYGKIIDGDLVDDEVPAIVRSVYGIGPTQTLVPFVMNGSSAKRPTRVVKPLQDAVTNAQGKPVSIRRFLDGSASCIAGILWASDIVWNLGWDASRSLKLVHNPTATVPLKRRSIATRCEMWTEDSVLKHRGRCASFGPYTDDGTAGG